MADIPAFKSKKRIVQESLGIFRDLLTYHSSGSSDPTVVEEALRSGGSTPDRNAKEVFQLASDLERLCKADAGEVAEVLKREGAFWLVVEIGPSLSEIEKFLGRMLTESSAYLQRLQGEREAFGASAKELKSSDQPTEGMTEQEAVASSVGVKGTSEDAFLGRLYLYLAYQGVLLGKKGTVPLAWADGEATSAMLESPRHDVSPAVIGGLFCEVGDSVVAVQSKFGPAHSSGFRKSVLGFLSEVSKPRPKKSPIPDAEKKFSEGKAI